MNIFNIFKKKNAKPIEPAIMEPLTNELQSEPEISSDITIHVMPEHFRGEHIKVSQAKTTGLIIIAGGIVFMLIIAGLFYYFLTKGQTKQAEQVAPAAEQVKTETTTPEQSEEQPANISTTTTTTITNLPTETLVATSTDMTTESNIVSGAADLVIGIDSDGDGLTDEEEKIFGSNSESLDTDNDGYNDQTEVVNLYNPAGVGPISINPNIEIYQNRTYNYSLIYPKNWSQTISGGDDSIMFKAGDNSFIQVITQANNKQQSIEEWYQKQFNLATIDQANLVSTVSWQGIANSDGLTIYLVDLGKKYIFTLAYNPAANNTLNYSTLFQAIIKSFKITP